MSLAAFQHRFAAALRGEGDLAGHGDPAALAPGLTVYRNTVANGAVDALAANYPTVERLVGPDWFVGAARAFVRQTPPTARVLAAYGEGFDAFLASSPQAADLPYLPAVARLDRLWIESHFAAEAPPLPANALAGLAPDALFARTLPLHPSARLAWFDLPAVSLWALNRPPAPTPGGPIELDWRPEGALLVRPHGAVETMTLDAAGHAFVLACAQGRTLGEAALAALEADPGFDLSAHLAALLSLGAFAEPESAR